MQTQLQLAVNKFLSYGGSLVTATNSGAQEQVETENALQVVMAKLTRAKVNVIKEILGRPEYKPELGMKNLGPNEAAQKLELDRLLDELDLNSDYKQLAAQETQLELRLSLLKMKAKQIAVALRMWEQFNGSFEAILAQPEIAKEVGEGLLMTLGNIAAKIEDNLVESEGQ